MNNKCCLYDKKGPIVWITLNRPKVLNALNRKLWREIYDNLVKAEKDYEVRAIVITGAGRAFSAGDDIKEVASLKDRNEIKSFFIDFAVPTVTKLIEISKPTIAAVNGIAYGGGCEIAMLCDIVVASENALFAVPEGLIGAIAPIASTIGTYIIGKLNISKMVLTGDPITAKEAKLIGLVNEVVRHEELRTAAERLARKTMLAASSSIKVMKKLLNRYFSREELQYAIEELIKILQTDEGKEGHRAFIEKRPPEWALKI